MDQKRQRPKRRKLKIVLFSLLAFVVLAVTTVTLFVSWRDDDGGTYLSDIIAKTLSSEGNKVEIGSVEGALSSKIVLRNLTMTDRDGVWLTMDRAELDWSRAALITGKLSVNLLQIDHLDILRKPQIGASAATADQQSATFPELPVKAVVKNFQMLELSIAEPVLGVPARLTMNGMTELGDPDEGLKLMLAIKRLDGPGTIGVALSYVPETEALSLDIHHDEPAGGLAARLMRIDGLPPVQFAVTGRGVLDDFKATMTYAAGDKQGASGTATLLRDGSGRRLDIHSDARIAALLPQPFSLVAAGTTLINGRVVFADDKSIAIPDFTIASDLAKFGLSGTIKADRALDLTINAGAISGQDGRTRAAGGELERFALNATIRGAVTAPTIEAKLDIAGLKTPQGGLTSGTATVSAAPEGKLAAGASPLTQRWGLRANAAFDGIVTTERQWSDAAGSSIKLTLDATRRETGIFDIKIFDLTTPTLTANFAGTVSERGGDGALKLSAPDLSAFAGMTDRKLRGALNLDARISGSIDKTLIVDTDASLQKLFLDIPQADGLLQGAATLKGRTQIAGKALTFDNIRLTAAHLGATLDGTLAEAKADSRLQVVIDDLSKADPRLKGKLTADAAVTGTSLRPDVKLSVQTDNAAALDQPIRKMVMDINAKDVLGAVVATLDLQGDIGNRPLTGKALLQRSGAESWKLGGLDFRFSSASATGGLTAEKGLVAGDLQIDAANLNELSALALTRLSGAFNAEISLSTTDGKQGGRLIAKGRDISANGAEIKVLDADLTASDLYARPVLNGFLTGSNWLAGGQRIDTIALKAQGNANGSNVTLQANGQGLNMDARASVASAEAIKVTLESLAVKRGPRNLTLAKPVTFAIADGMVKIPELAITSNGGQVALAGTLGMASGKDSDLAVTFRKLPLSVAGIAAPALDLGGTIDGQVKITGPIATPLGQYDLDVRGAINPEIRNAGLPPVDAAIKGQLKGNATVFDAAVTLGRLGQFKIDGSAPLNPNGAIAVKLRGQVNAAAANSMLSASGQQVAGTVTVDAAINGRVSKPNISGSFVLANGSFTDPLQGVRLTNIQGRVTGQGEALVVERITAQTRNNGTITITGRVEADPARGFPGSFKIDANRAELVSSELVTAVSNMALTMSGPLTEKPQITGKVDLIKMDVTLPNRLPATAQPLPNAKHIAPPPNVRARLEAQKKAQQRARKTPPFDAVLNLTVSAPNQIFVRGQGVDAELGGDLRITGTSRDPKVLGGFDMRRGKLTIIGQRLDFTRGKLTFSGDMTPELDFLAQTQAGGVTARVAVTGPAFQPAFDMSSTPELPRDEVLSRLLFAKSSGSLSAFQALQLAQAVAQLSGKGGPDVFDEARKALGLDSLDITTGTSGGPAVGASRYINDRISVGVRAGANPEDNAATINMDITKRLKLQGEVGATGNTSIGIGAEWEY